MFIGMLRLTGQQMTADLKPEARVSLRTAQTFFTKRQRYIYIYTPVQMK